MNRNLYKLICDPRIPDHIAHAAGEVMIMASKAVFTDDPAERIAAREAHDENLEIVLTYLAEQNDAV